MDSIRVSEAPDPGSIPGEATRGERRKRKRAKYTLSLSVSLSGSWFMVHGRELGRMMQSRGGVPTTLSLSVSLSGS